MAGDRPLIWGFGEAEFCPSCQFVARRRAIGVATIFARPGLAVLADVCGFRVGDVLADGKGYFKRTFQAA
jgi:hypothetical protein